MAVAVRMGVEGGADKKVNGEAGGGAMDHNAKLAWVACSNKAAWELGAAEGIGTQADAVGTVGNGELMGVSGMAAAAGDMSPLGTAAKADVVEPVCVVMVGSTGVCGGGACSLGDAAVVTGNL